MYRTTETCEEVEGGNERIEMVSDQPRVSAPPTFGRVQHTPDVSASWPLQVCEKAVVGLGAKW